MAHATMMGNGIPVRKTEKSHPQAPGSIPAAVFLRVAPEPASSDGTVGGWWVTVCSNRPGRVTSSMDK